MGSPGRLAAVFSLATLVLMMALIPVIPNVSQAAPDVETEELGLASGAIAAQIDEPGATDPLHGNRVATAFKDTATGLFLSVAYDGNAKKYSLIEKEVPDLSSIFLFIDEGQLYGSQVYALKNLQYGRYLKSYKEGNVGVWDTTDKIDAKSKFAVVPIEQDGPVLIYNLDYGGLDITSSNGSWVATTAGLLGNCTLFDQEGYLGEPVHWVVEDLRPTIIMGEPPKHIDYIVDADGKLREVNISRKSGFYSQFEDSNQTEISSSSTNTSDWNFGVQVGAEVKTGFSLPIVGGVQTEIKTQVGDSYSEHKSEIEKNMMTTKTTETLTASTDDYLIFNLTRFHIWIYPVKWETVKSEDSNEGPLYMQIVVPASADTNPQYANGRDLEWYQPVHQNGNLFSYAWSKEQISRFEGTDALHLLTSARTFSSGGNETKYDISWTQVTEEGKEVKSQHKLSVDSSIGVSGKVETASAKTTVTNHYDRTWSQLTTSNTKLTTSQGIKIAKSVLDERYAYAVSPFIYTSDVEKVTQDGASVQMPTGTIKLAFTVNPTQYQAVQWWKNVSGYNSKPDLALNLPHQWVSDNGNTWEFDEDAYNFQVMKGLFVQDSDGNLIKYMTEEGEKVTVKARVYNYSFVDVQNVKVKFEAQQSTDNKTWGDRFEVGPATIPIIHGFQNAAAQNNWEWAEITFDTSGMAGSYQFWVTLDPDDEIEEIEGHDSGEKYSNNQGYFRTPLIVAPEGSSENMAGHNLTFKAHSDLVALSNSQPSEGERAIVSVWVGAEGANASDIFVSFYDGDPEQGGQLIDMEFVPFISEGKEYFLEIPWKAYGEAGNHEIHAVIHSQWGETDITDNVAMAAIEVVPASEGLQWYHIVEIVLGAMAVMAVVVFGFTLIRRAR